MTHELGTGYEVYYWVPTASGRKALRAAINLSKEECEEICEKCETLGYKIEMVN